MLPTNNNSALFARPDPLLCRQVPSGESAVLRKAMKAMLQLYEHHMQLEQRAAGTSPTTPSSNCVFPSRSGRPAPSSASPSSRKAVPGATPSPDVFQNILDASARSKTALRTTPALAARGPGSVYYPLHHHHHHDYNDIDMPLPLATA